MKSDLKMRSHYRIFSFRLSMAMALVAFYWVFYLVFCLVDVDVVVVVDCELLWSSSIVRRTTSRWLWGSSLFVFVFVFFSFFFFFYSFLLLLLFCFFVLPFVLFFCNFFCCRCRRFDSLLRCAVVGPVSLFLPFRIDFYWVSTEFFLGLTGFDWLLPSFTGFSWL